MKHVSRNTNRSHRSGEKARRAARVRISLIWACALGVILAWVGVWHEVPPWKSQSGGVVLAEVPTDDPATVFSEGEDPTGGGPNTPPPTQIPDAQPGAPRPWEMGLSVSPYSTVNVLNRNVLTVMPIIGWSGVGPDMQMNLYHNSDTVDATFDTTRAMGFDLGPGWTTSFSAHLFEVGTNDRIVVADDGTRDLFTWKISAWVAPPGVHTALSFDAAGSTYTLKYKDQSFDTFDVDGLLIAVSDAFGNQITIQRVNGRIVTVTDASGRLFLFLYVGTNLDKIIDPIEVDENTQNIQLRRWTFAYDAEGRMSAVTDAMAFLNDFQYDGAGRISQIRDKYDPNDPNTPAPGWYVLEYDPFLTRDGDALRKVTDPLNTQQFFNVGGNGAFRFHVDYTDRRGNKWVYESWQDLPEALIESPPVAAIVNPLGQRTSFRYDGDRNVISSTDALGNAWTFAYDANGNTTSIASPLHVKGAFFHKQVWAYDEYPVGDPLEGLIFNNLTSYTDAEGNVTTLHYAQAGYPTLLTSIVEPETVLGEGPATTRFEYYIAPFVPGTACDAAAGQCKHGQIQRATDPNAVVTNFDYDEWGQQSIYQEGEFNGEPVFGIATQIDSGSRPYFVESGAGASRAGGSAGTMTYNSANALVFAGCAPATPRSEPPAANAPFGLIVPSCAPSLSDYETSGSSNMDYDPMGRITNQDISLEFRGGPFPQSATRTVDRIYDALGAQVSTTLVTTEHDGPARQFDYPYDLTTEIFTRVGPDLGETVNTLDEANRLESVFRSIAQFPGANPEALMLAGYGYYADGRVHSVIFLNFARTEYTYDAAGRLTAIDHRNGVGLSLLKLTYEHDKRDLPVTVTEVDALNAVTTTNFTYDARGRLTGEIRSGAAPYDLLYEYDKGGNRTRKVDLLNEIEMLYEYDMDLVGIYGTANNRLQMYITCDMSVADAVCDLGAPTPALVSYTVYHYNDVGNVTRVFVYTWNPQENRGQVTATRFVYARNGSTVTFVIGEAWDERSPETCNDNYEIRYAREFRYDGSRQRYLVRDLKTSSLEFGTVQDTSPPSRVWSDYDGDSIYGDFTVNGTTLTQTAIYEPGIARSFAPSDAFATQYYHANAIGSMRMITNATSPPSVVSESSYTAFGEQVGGATQRYGYAGAWGYQTATSETPGDAYATDFQFMHLGARYYDPATGRFLQRDPIGIQGGLNVYSYVENAPTMWVDPEGLVNGGGGGTGYHSSSYIPGVSGPSYPGGPFPYNPTMQERRDREDRSALVAGAGLGAMGCFLGGPAGWALWAVVVGGGVYRLWPL